MKLHLQYISTSEGKPTAVVIPVDEWQKLEKDYQKLVQYAKLKTVLKGAFEEFEEIKSGKKKAVTLTEFLNDY